MSAPALRLSELDRRILDYIAANPGCTKRQAGTLGGRERLSPRGVSGRYEKVGELIWRGLIRDEGRSNRASLHLTKEGQRKLYSEGMRDLRILAYVARNSGCTKNAVSRARGATRARIESLIKRGLIREDGRTRGLHLTDEGWRAFGPVESLAVNQQILLYIASHPGCGRIEAAAAGYNPAWIDGGEWGYRHRMLHYLIQEEQVRVKSQSSRARLYLTDAGWWELFGAV